MKQSDLRLDGEEGHLCCEKHIRKANGKRDFTQRSEVTSRCGAAVEDNRGNVYTFEYAVCPDCLVLLEPHERAHIKRKVGVQMGEALHAVLRAEIHMARLGPHPEFDVRVQGALAIVRDLLLESQGAFPDDRIGRLPMSGGNPKIGAMRESYMERLKQA